MQKHTIPEPCPSFFLSHHPLLSATTNQRAFQFLPTMSTNKPPPGHFSLLYFASASSFTKKAWEHIAAPLEAAKLFEVLENKYAGFRKKVLNSCAVTINLEYIDIERDEDDGEMLQRIILEGDEVAIIPPVSSG